MVAPHDVEDLDGAVVAGPVVGVRLFMLHPTATTDIPTAKVPTTIKLRMSERFMD